MTILRKRKTEGPCYETWYRKAKFHLLCIPPSRICWGLRSCIGKSRTSRRHWESPCDAPLLSDWRTRSAAGWLCTAGCQNNPTLGLGPLFWMQPLPKTYTPKFSKFISQRKRIKDQDAILLHEIVVMMLRDRREFDHRHNRVPKTFVMLLHAIFTNDDHAGHAVVFGRLRAVILAGIVEFAAGKYLLQPRRNASLSIVGTLHCFKHRQYLFPPCSYLWLYL